MTTHEIALSLLPLEQLHDSPFQPRSQYAGLEGLADSIRADGVQQPLKVRPVHPNPLRDDITSGWEIVFGHRRKRAAEMAGLTHVPCLVTAMTDAEVRSAQLAENIQRDNMKALDEAQGYRAMLDADPLLTQAELARRLGKSPSHVAGRLRLLHLVPSVRLALDHGRIGAEVALLIARVGPPAVQHKALGAIAAQNLRSDLEDGGARSLRAVRRLLAERFTLALADALFDPEDTTLVPDAGACSACPRRSGNAAEWDDVVQHDNGHAQQRVDWLSKTGPNLCTDPDCFDAKKRAHLKRQADALRAEGAEVIEGSKARAAIDAQGNVKGGFVEAKAVKAQLAKVRKALARQGQAVPKPVTIQDPRQGKTVEAYRVDDLQRVGVSTLAAKTDQRAARGQNCEAQRQKEQAEVQAEAQARRQLLLAVRAAMRGTPWTQADLLMVVRHVLDQCHHDQAHLLAELWGADNHALLADTLEAMPHAQLAQLLLDVALTHQVPVHARWDIQHEPQALLDAAHRYGVDVAAARAEPAAEAQAA